MANDSPTKWALLIGIDDYKGPDISDLHGCVNDIMLMRDILIGNFNILPENIEILENDKATRSGIFGAFQTLINNANVKRGDVIIIHYSGHGSQIKDISGDEIDGLDETIVPYDARTKDIFDITDDEINGLMKQLTEKTKNVTFIFDSCHSGDVVRLGNTFRMIKPDERLPPHPESFAVSIRGSEGEADIRPNDSDYVLISGSLANELSNETSFSGIRHGVLTWFLGQSLRSTKMDSTYRSVMDEVKSEVSVRYPSQHPQIEGPGADLVVFGTDKINLRPYVLVNPIDRQNVEVQGGKIYGLHKDTTLKVFPPKTSNFEKMQSVTTIKITDVQDFAARAQIVQGDAIEPNSKAILEAVFFGETSIPIFVNDQQSVSLRKIKDSLVTMQALTFTDEASARFLVRQQENKILIQSGDLELVATPVPVNDEGHVQRVVDQIKNLAHWAVVLDLENRNSGININFDLRRKDDHSLVQAQGEVNPGALLTYSVTNQHNQPLYLYVLDVSSDGSVALLYPRGGQQKLAPEATLEKTIKMVLPSGYSTVTDTLKILATTEPIDPSVFPQGPIQTAQLPQMKGAGDPLNRFLANSLRGTRTSEPVEVESWVTSQKLVKIRDNQTNLTAFAAHFDEPIGIQDIKTKLQKTKSLCDDPNDQSNQACFEINTIDAEKGIFEIIPTEQKRGEEVSISVGNAFDEAYAIRDHLDARRVEPLLEVEVPGIENELGIDKRGIIGDDDHDPLAEKDDEWNLKQISVFAAWKKIREHYNVPEGEEAANILVAHPDTGFRHHPETWNDVEEKSPVDAKKGHNYYDDDTDSFDPLLTGRPLDNPGHGTSSGSVIVSPNGCQLPDTKHCVNGIGRGAKLIPLRVHRSVSQFNTRNLARAILDVAKGNISGKPKLISIAMGGPPTFTMRKAVKTAEKNGVLIIAAAGNYVRIVVWPARFDSTIAVAANNVRCLPWKHSSRGSAVDICAPGESVWGASINKKSTQVTHLNCMGKGTTYATGNVAGAAALWLAWHKDKPKLKDLMRNGLLTKAFRSALKESAWQPKLDPAQNPPDTHCDTNQWDTNFGPGILDVNRLLEIPLEKLEIQSQKETRSPEKIPLFASLYPEDTLEENIKSDYLKLFGPDQEDKLAELSEYETEVLHHYTMNEEVRRTLDAVVAGQRGLEPIERVREALLKQDLSKRVRGALEHP